MIFLWVNRVIRTRSKNVARSSIVKYTVKCGFRGWYECKKTRTQRTNVPTVEVRQSYVSCYIIDNLVGFRET